MLFLDDLWVTRRFLKRLEGWCFRKKRQEILSAWNPNYCLPFVRIKADFWPETKKEFWGLVSQPRRKVPWSTLKVPLYIRIILWVDTKESSGWIIYWLCWWSFPDSHYEARRIRLCLVFLGLSWKARQEGSASEISVYQPPALEMVILSFVRYQILLYIPLWSLQSGFHRLPLGIPYQWMPDDDQDLPVDRKWEAMAMIPPSCIFLLSLIYSQTDGQEVCVPAHQGIPPIEEWEHIARNGNPPQHNFPSSG